MDPLWIFGYGSLMWRPDIPYEECRIGYIRGWERRFYQGSTDHRGVPGAPGRVVTLLPKSGALCWGVAFKVPHVETEKVLAQLDHREKGGYQREQVRFDGRDAELPAVEVLVYRAAPDNPEYLGPADMQDMAQQIRVSCGPSGPNLEYLIQLVAFLRRHDLPDAHAHELLAHAEAS